MKSNFLKEKQKQQYEGGSGKGPAASALSKKGSKPHQQMADHTRGAAGNRPRGLSNVSASGGRQSQGDANGGGSQLTNTHLEGGNLVNFD